MNATNPSTTLRAGGERSRTTKGFTLIELMVVIVIVGIIAAFGIPSYTKSIQKSHERDMAAQLTAVHAANLLYRSYNGKYWDTAASSKNMAEINSALSLNIIANDGTTYDYNSDGNVFTAAATWSAYTLKVTQAAIGATNPCCVTLNCLSLASC
ncbi:MAG: prepilin-type N-terminal cleavage/methylation domain-containing protein [Candidatus Omnitrophica bacterium]|nr:prepilin-type N-terminal cleavage/methylation domain-containing protein [Candidatus Omnitrophota bacterium]